MLSSYEHLLLLQRTRVHFLVIIVGSEPSAIPVEDNALLVFMITRYTCGVHTYTPTYTPTRMNVFTNSIVAPLAGVVQ